MPKLHKTNTMNLLFLLGPPAVGKMTVGQALTQKLDYKLFHNHHSIELALEFFWFGSPEFKAIKEGIRELIFDTCAQSKNLNGLIFTLVMAFDLQEDWDYLRDIQQKFEAQGWTIYFVELYAPLATRLERNKTPNRLKHKASKRDLASSEKGILENETAYRLTTKEGEFKEENYLKIDTTEQSAASVAALIVDYFSLLGES